MRVVPWFSNDALNTKYARSKPATQSQRQPASDRHARTIPMHSEPKPFPSAFPTFRTQDLRWQTQPSGYHLLWRMFLNTEQHKQMRSGTWMSSRTTSAHENKTTEWFHGFAIAEQQITIPDVVHTRENDYRIFHQSFSKPFRLAAPNIREEYVPEGSSDTIITEQIKFHRYLPRSIPSTAFFVTRMVINRIDTTTGKLNTAISTLLLFP